MKLSHSNAQLALSPLNYPVVEAVSICFTCLIHLPHTHACVLTLQTLRSLFFGIGRYEMIDQYAHHGNDSK